MSETPEVLSRADSLMMRRRSFVANRPTPAAARDAGLPAPDEDLPVLTEIVSADAALTQPPVERHAETQVSLLAAEIAHAFGEQLANDLPALLENALNQANQELRAGIAAIMESALRDFIARRKQLDLPLEENADKR